MVIIMSFLLITKSKFSWGKVRDDSLDLGIISLIFTMRHKNGYLRTSIGTFLHCILTKQMMVPILKLTRQLLDTFLGQTQLICITAISPTLPITLVTFLLICLGISSSAWCKLLTHKAAVTHILGLNSTDLYHSDISNPTNNTCDVSPDPSRNITKRLA